MDYRQTLLVLLAVLLCSSQGLTESSTEATLVQTPSGTSTEMMNKLNLPIFELPKTVILLDEMNSRIMTRLDEMNSESVKRFEEINSTMFSLFDKLDKKTQKNSDESLKKSEEIDNKIKSLEISITNSSEIHLNKYLTLSEDMKKLSTKLDRIEAHLQEGSSNRKEKQFVLFTNEEKTWQEAYDDCINRDMSLASIESEEENNKVVSLIKNSDGVYYKPKVFWLSGTDLGHTGRWVWKSTGRDVTYNQWIEGQPDNYVSTDGQVQHCMYVWSDLRWSDRRCNLPENYICQHWV